MNSDKDINEQPEDRQAEPDGDRERISLERPSVQVVLTPPPPSAPSEFLAAQWRAASARDGIRPAMAPPPPSAPGEFLGAQWLEGEPPAEQTPAPDTGLFADALPATVVNIEELARLIAEVPADPEPAAQDDEETRDTARADESPPIRIRGLPLEPGEEIAQVFLPNEGLVSSVPPRGQALILTSSRLIAFRGLEGFRDTHFALTSEISQCSVRTGQRNWGAILQGLMIMVGGAFLYLVVGYWLAGRISGPNVPVLNMDLAPLVALLIVLAGLLVLLQNYFSRPAGAVVFHGAGVEIAFPFRSSLDLSQVYAFVDMTHGHRRNAAPQEPDGSSRPQG